MSVFKASQFSSIPFYGKGFCLVTYTTTHFTRLYSLKLPFSHDIVDLLSRKSKLSQKDFQCISRMIRTHPDVSVIK